MKRLKTASAVLLVLVFVSPVLGALISTIGQSAETNQYAGLQWALMGIYNLPFFLTSLVAFFIASSFLRKQNAKASTKSFSISIAASIIGTILMLGWGVSALR